jgi:hypothetical protein
VLALLHMGRKTNIVLQQYRVKSIVLSDETKFVVEYSMVDRVNDHRISDG